VTTDENKTRDNHGKTNLVFTGRIRAKKGSRQLSKPGCAPIPTIEGRGGGVLKKNNRQISKRHTTKGKSKHSKNNRPKTKDKVKDKEEDKDKDKDERRKTKDKDKNKDKAK
jgi:hypothetical protein